MALIRLAVNIDNALMKQIDEYAATLHITRTAAVAVLLSTALQAQKSMNTLEELMKAYKAEKAAKKGKDGAGA
jgi:metal-responsive CopG/Arc/MetJ family transcriptional regulator